VSQYVFSSVDVILLGVFRSQANVGVYAVAYQAYTVLSAAAVTATAVFLPLFVSLQMAERHHLIVRYMERSVPQLLLVISVLAGVGIALVPLAVPVVFSAKFAAASEPLAILGLGLAFLFASYLIAPILTLHEQTRATAAINGVAAAINVAADLILLGVFHFGISAPAIATTGALAIVFIAFYARARKTLGTMGWPDVVIGLPVVAALVAALTLDKVPAALVGIGAVAALTAAILAWRCPFTREDVELVEKLEMPGPIKRAAIQAIRFVT
jgi:O-antigen/teichoic acid export membrane protein